MPKRRERVEICSSDFRILIPPPFTARFYNVIAEYHLDRLGDLTKALEFYGRALSLATQCGDTRSQTRALGGLSAVKWFQGNYHEGLRLGDETQRMGAANGDFNGESVGIRVQAMCCTALGDFKRSAQFLAEGRELVPRAGLQGGDLDHMLMSSTADVHQLKTEYAEARSMHAVIARKTSPVFSPVTHAYALVNIAFLDTITGASAEAVSRSLDAATAAFRGAHYPRGLAACELYRADLLRREGATVHARAEYVRLVAALRGSDEELAACCHANSRTPRIPCTWTQSARDGPWCSPRSQCARRRAIRSQCIRCCGASGTCLRARVRTTRRSASLRSRWMGSRGWTCTRAGANVCGAWGRCTCGGVMRTELRRCGRPRDHCLSARSRQARLRTSTRSWPRETQIHSKKGTYKLENYTGTRVQVLCV
ncbi:hypothetical protein B0H17DRAFT_30168 [Mycena rosella]|uniref:Uncharacterized protein n=1 Tax=Mycena rosella TaxID=1033263 RepID=A0AAD7GAK4_MYCRO|nr:hypothetical protein B0H17DRAFT_30168 [Mycena rosella]